MTTGILSARVRQGIALMDLHHGPGWVWKVDPARLDINSPSHCVIGQVINSTTLSARRERRPFPDTFTRYDLGLMAMGIAPVSESEINAGFCAGDGPHPTLSRIWAFAIRRLREQRPQAVA